MRMYHERAFPLSELGRPSPAGLPHQDQVQVNRDRVSMIAVSPRSPGCALEVSPRWPGVSGVWIEGMVCTVELDPSDKR